jgi:CHAD domain-containing protein
LIPAVTAARDYYAIEGIHELRVEIKRIRAFYALIQMVSTGPGSEPERSLRPVFRAAGRLRDIDIAQGATMPRLAGLDLREYVNYLKHKEMRLRSRFAAVATAYLGSGERKKRRRLETTISNAAAGEAQARLAQKIGQLVGRLDGLLRQKVSPGKKLHAVRKISKQLRYSLDVWKECFGQSERAETAASRLKRSYDCLGAWHDLIMTLDSVEKFRRRRGRAELVRFRDYIGFRTQLKDEAEKSLGRYARGLGALRLSLVRLSEEMAARRIRAAATTRVKSRG